MTQGPAAAPARRPLGRSGLSVAPLVFGGNVFGWTIDEAQSFALLDRFVDAGFNGIDTADYYAKYVPGKAGGESETVIGNWLAQGGGRRDRVVIATKVGLPMAPDKAGLSRRWITEAVEHSLRRLRTDRIDLYQSHIPDPATPQDETLRAFDDLVQSGKVRAIGASNHSAEQLGEALQASAKGDLARYETLQPLYNLVDRSGFEGEVQDLCAAEGIGVIPYYSLASGFLTGKYRSEADLHGKARDATVRNYLTPRGLGILAALDAVGAELEAKPAQVALAWLMGRKAVAAAIASATTAQQLDELLAAAGLSLSAGQVARLDEASAG